MRSFSYFLKSGKGTYGKGHGQITTDDLYINHSIFNQGPILEPIQIGIKQEFSPTLGNFSNEYTVQFTRAYYIQFGDSVTFSIAFGGINSLVPNPSQFFVNLRLPFFAAVHTPILIGRYTEFSEDLYVAEVLRGQSIIAFYDQASTRVSNLIVSDGQLTLSGTFITGAPIA